MACFGAESQQSRNTLKGFLVFALGIFFVYSSFVFVIYLQSSINIKDGLGTTSLSCSYISSIVFGLLFTPVFLRKFGVKKCILVSEMTYVIYIASNYYPEYYTMIPASIIVGVGEATMWPCVIMMNVYYGTQYSDLMKHKKKPTKYYVGLFTGYYFTIHHFNKIFGGVISFFTQNLFSDQMHGNDTSLLQYNSTMSPSIDNGSIMSTQKYQFCGANDCQDVDIIDESIEQYTPTDSIKLIVLISFLLLFALIPIVVHAFALPKVKTQQRGVSLEDDSKEECNKEILEIQIEDSESELKSKKYTSDVVASSTTKRKKDDDKFILETLKDVGRHLLNVKQLLIIPITIYDGLLMGFVISELPRSYVSCISGFSTIGFYTALFGVGHVLATFMISKIRKKVSRTPIFTACLILDVLNYMFCLFWKPNVENSWLIYILYLCFGITDGIWQPCINILYVEYFPNNHHIAGSVWTVMFHIGMAVQFAWSASLCVYIKIYMSLGSLIVGFLCFCVAEYLHKNERKESQR